MYRYTVTPYDDRPPDIGIQPTRVMVPFVDGMLRAETVAALRDTRLMIDYVLIDPEDVGAYSQAFALRWNLGVDLVVIEQDMEPAPGMVAQLGACGKPWCSFPYYCGTATPAYGLGMCKFTAGLQSARPSLGEQAARDHRGLLYSRHWRGLNERIISLMEHFGHYAHLHPETVSHLHEYPVPAVDHG